MRNALNLAAVIGIAAGALVYGQSGDANKVLADAREALGGEKKLAAIKTIAITGRSQRTTASGTTVENEFEMFMEMPDKYMKREALVNMGNMSMYRMSGFNGDGVINEMDTPPQLSGGGNMVIRMAGPGGMVMPGGAALTPEQQANVRRAVLLGAKHDFTRLTLGMLAQSFAHYPLTFTHAGQAESPDGKADIIDVKGEADFSVRLFIDAQTHLPLMLSWMAKEPMQMTTRGGPGGPGATTVVMGGGSPAVAMPPGGHPGGAAAPPPPPPPPPPPGGGGAAPAQSRPNMTPEEREKMMAQMREQMKEAEAKRRTVEYRLFYADYKDVNGVMLPHKFQRSIEGKPTEEITFDTVKLNQKIDAKKFEVTKEKS